MVVNPRIDNAWCFMGFYGAPEVANQEDSWSMLNISALNLFCGGCVLEILMKSKELMRNWEGLFSLRNRCKISEIAWIFMVSRT